jgi:hypothetical protein
VISKCYWFCPKIDPVWEKLKNKSANFFQNAGVGQAEAPKNIFPGSP